VKSSRCKGFVDTGDIFELRGDRRHFVGWRDGIVNIGSLKSHPEVEAVINKHAVVPISRDRSWHNPIAGAVVVTDVILADSFYAGRIALAFEYCTPKLAGTSL
jgi:hypothetical protein